MEETIKLFKKALEGELAASAFYSMASEETKHDDTRMVFLNLSTSEDDHAQELVNKFNEVFGSVEFDAQAHLDALIKQGGHVNVEMSETVKTGTPHEALKLAISLENAAKATYDRLADEAIDPELKKYCIELSAEEEQHAKELTNALNSLDMDANDRPGL